MKQIVLIFVFLIGVITSSEAIDPAIIMTTEKNIGDNISFNLVVPIHTEIQIDYGDEQLSSPIIVTTSPLAIKESIKGNQPIKIYGSNIYTLICDENQLNSIDVSNCPTIKTLNCINNKLTTLDLSQCTSMHYLECYNNELSSLNGIENCLNLLTLNCQNNLLKTINLSNSTKLTDLLCFNNQLESLDLSKCIALKNINCNSNKLTTLDVAKCTSLENLSCALNRLSFATLPVKQSKWVTYNYTPQPIPITIPASIAIESQLDLSKQSLVNGTTTVFIWKTASGTTLPEGIDYTISNGIITFNNIQAEKVYGVLTNAAFTGLTLTTTQATISPFTGIHSTTNVPPIQMYITNQTLHMTLPVTASQVTVTDLQGRTIAQTPAEYGHNTLELPGCGLYLVRVETPEGNVTQKVMVK